MKRNRESFEQRKKYYDAGGDTVRLQAIDIVVDNIKKGKLDFSV